MKILAIDGNKKVQDATSYTWTYLIISDDLNNLNTLFLTKFQSKIF